MFLRGCEFMLFCNNLYLFCRKMSKKWFQVTAEAVKFKYPGIFFKRRGVSVKTSGRFKKMSGFPKIGKDLFTYSQNNTSETFYFSYYKFLFSSLEI